MTCLESNFIPYHAETRIGLGGALIFAPHPDDEIFGCTGAILQHMADGDAVNVIVVTDGAFGVGEDGGSYAETRKAESRAAGELLGYGQPRFWDYPDRGLVFDEGLVQRVKSAIASSGSRWIYAPSWWEIHPDHTVLSRAVTKAVQHYRGEVQLVLYEVAVPLHANLLLDITLVQDQKRDAMACFASQIQKQAYDHHVMALNRYRSYSLPAHVHVAEAYRWVKYAAIPQSLTLPLMMPVDVSAVGG